MVFQNWYHFLRAKFGYSKYRTFLTSPPPPPPVGGTPMGRSSTCEQRATCPTLAFLRFPTVWGQATGLSPVEKPNKCVHSDVHTGTPAEPLWHPLRWQNRFRERAHTHASVEEPGGHIVASVPPPKKKTHPPPYSSALWLTNPQPKYRIAKDPGPLALCQFQHQWWTAPSSLQTLAMTECETCQCKGSGHQGRCCGGCSRPIFPAKPYLCPLIL